MNRHQILKDLRRIYDLAMEGKNFSLALKVKEIEVKILGIQKDVDETLTPEILERWLEVIEKNIHDLSTSSVG